MIYMYFRSLFQIFFAVSHRHFDECSFSNVPVCVKFPDVGGQLVALKPEITHFLNFLNPVVLQPFFAYFGGVLRVVVLLKPLLKWLFILCIGQYYVLQYIKIHKSIHNAINMMNWPHSLTRKIVSDRYTSTAMFDCCVAIHEI